MQISFSQPKKGQTYLVEFHVELLVASTTYSFQLMSYPSDISEDIFLDGGQAIPIVVLIGPDNSSDVLGAELSQVNNDTDEAGWRFYSVRVSTTQ